MSALSPEATNSHVSVQEASITIPLAPDKRRERVALLALIALYLASAYGFAVVTPYGEAPDEFSHLAYIEHIVNFGKVPDITPSSYTYESFEPPLYYLVAAFAVATGRTLTSKDLRAPLAPPVYVRPNRQPGIDLAVLLHPPEDRWPFTVYMLRFYSVLLGLGLIVLTYATARAIVPWPAPAIVPLSATAFAALIPQANFIRASISNENLADLISAFVVWLLSLHLMRPHSDKRIFWIGVAFGLALVSKLSVLPLALPALWVLWVRRQRGRWAFLRDLTIVGALASLIGGWLYIYKWVVYGDPLALGAWYAMMPPDGVYSLADLFWFQEPFREMLWNSFWGVYGWQQVFMPDWIYSAFIIATLLAVTGGVYLVARRALSWGQRGSTFVLLLTVALLYAFIVQSSTYLVAWQGREMYPALSSVCLLLGLGLGGLILGRGAVQPVALSRWRALLSDSSVVIVSVGLLALNLYAIIWVVLPALNP
ncbi:MAG TPA: hypothetical protein VJ183_04265 [Chloroflexia bacterium]|nr:hypothetical protein [Chloroflexia bacterium]